MNARRTGFLGRHGLCRWPAVPATGRYLVFGLLLAALAARPPAVPAQTAPARVDVQIGADSIRVGEPFSVSLTAEHTFSTEVRFPTADAGPLVFGDLEVLSRGEVSERYLGSAGPGRRVDSVAYRVATFALDSARIPPLPVEVVVGQDTVLVSTQEQQLPVIATVGPDARGLKGLAPLASFPQPVWPWALLAIAGAVAVAGLVYWWRQRNEPDAAPEAAPAPAPPSAFEAAHNRLNRLSLPADDRPVDVEDFYVELSALLRTYLAARLGIAARERTTAEIVSALTDHPDVPTAARKRVRAVLEVADLVKFADSRPRASDHQTARDETRAAIRSIERAQRADAPAPPSGDEREKASSPPPERAR